jgi:hypothetical protein
MMNTREWENYPKLNKSGKKIGFQLVAPGEVLTEKIVKGSQELRGRGVRNARV